jgi:hypothetical protein
VDLHFTRSIGLNAPMSLQILLVMTDWVQRDKWFDVKVLVDVQSSDFKKRTLQGHLW